jgi:hypothetical protein
MRDYQPKPARGAAALAFAATLLALAPARAQEGVVVAPVIVPPKPAPRPDAVPLDENTARLIGANRFKVGILALEYGITDYLSVGTDPPAWAVRTFASVLVPNLHVKGMLLRSSHVQVSARAAGYVMILNNQGVSGNAYIVPLTLYGSVKLAEPLWLHLQASYNWAKASGTGDVADTDVFGTVVQRTVQVGAMVEYRLSRVVALIARGYWQPWETPITFKGNGVIDPYTTATAELQVVPLKSHPIEGVAGVALTWKYVGVVAGAGYGHYFVPGMNLALPYNGFVPEGSLWAVF